MRSSVHMAYALSVTRPLGSSFLDWLTRPAFLVRYPGSPVRSTKSK